MNNSEPAIPEYSQEVIDDTFSLYCVGFSSAEISQRTGINDNTLRSWAKRYDWNRRRDKFEQFKQEKNPVENRVMMQAFAGKKRAERKKMFLEKTGEMAVKDAESWAQMDPDERIQVAPAISALNKVHRDNLGLNEEGEEQDRGHINLKILTEAPERIVRILAPHEVKQIESNAEPENHE